MITTEGLQKLGFESMADYRLEADSDGTVFISEWSSESPQPSEAEIEASHAEWQAEQVANAYQRERADLYKSLAEQLDLLYWDYKNGTEEWMAHIDAVKAAHPKPE